MSKVEELYDKNLIRLRTCCSVFNDLENKCSAKKCVCQSIAECLADEIMNCEKESPNSYAIKKKDEIEKVAKGNR